MNTFSERVKLKKQLDANTLKSSAECVYNSLGRTAVKASGKAQSRTALEMARICSFLKIDAPSFPSDMADAESIMQFAMTETGVMRRKIVTVGKWWKDGSMPLLCTGKDNSVTAMLPAVSGGYYFYDENQNAVIQNI